MSARDMIFEADDIDFSAYMQDTEAQHKVRSLESWADDLTLEFHPPAGQAPSPVLPWSRLSSRIELRRGEVSLWFGFNAHGKSLLLGQAMLSVAAQGERVCIASFEMQPRKTLARMCRQFVDAGAPTPAQINEFCAWGKGRMWLYDQTGSVDIAKVYAVIRYAVDKLGVTHFVIDNLTKCVAADDDYAGQKAIVDKLTGIAQDLDIHIHLVHHARKAADETRPPRKMDALGAGAITNLVDNVFVVWRNKAKAESSDPNPNDPDAVLICDKQRHGTGWEGIHSLRYHQRSQQYIDIGHAAMDMSQTPERFPRCYE